MGAFGVDETRMATQWGPHAIHLSPGRMVRLLDEVEDREVRGLMDGDRERFAIADEVTNEIHHTSSRLEAALRTLVAERSLDAFTMNFRELVEDGRFPTMPFLGLNKLLGEGLGYAGEGNATLAAHMAQMRQLCGVANFTEIYTVDYVKNRMVMTHMQECNPALARRDRKVRLVKKDFWAPGMEPYVGMHYTLEPGPVTLTNITEHPDGRFGYVVREAEIEDMAPFEDFDLPHWVAQLDGPVEDFLTRYSQAGGTHHLISMPGRQGEALRKLAHLQGFEYAAV
jgi:L-arabinose isomerase